MVTGNFSGVFLMGGVKGGFSMSTGFGCEGCFWGITASLIVTGVFYVGQVAFSISGVFNVKNTFFCC